MDTDFVVNCPLVQHRMPHIRFLYIGSRICSTLLSDPASRRRSCASLRLHLHQVVKGTFTLELSNLLGTQKSAHCAEDGAVGVTSREGVRGNSFERGHSRRLWTSCRSRSMRLLSVGCSAWNWLERFSWGLETQSRSCRLDRTRCAALALVPLLIHRT